MQSLNSSIPRGKPFTSQKEMPKGGGLPLCLTGVSILTQVGFLGISSCCEDATVSEPW